MESYLSQRTNFSKGTPEAKEKKGREEEFQEGRKGGVYYANPPKKNYSGRERV